MAEQRNSPAVVTPGMILDIFPYGEVLSAQAVAKRLGVHSNVVAEPLNWLLARGIILRSRNTRISFSDHYSPKRFFILAEFEGRTRPMHCYPRITTRGNLADDPEFKAIAVRRELAELTRRRA